MRDPRDRAFDKVAVVIVRCEVPEALDAYESFVRKEPIECLFEEAWVVSPDLKGEQKQRLGVGCPLVAPLVLERIRRVAPTGPCEWSQRRTRSLSVEV